MRRSSPVRRLALGLGLLLAVTVGGLLLAAWLALSDTPEVAQPVTVAPKDVGRVYGLVKRYGPTHNQPGVVRTAFLVERDLELLLAEGGRRAVDGVRPQVRLFARSAWVQLSVPVPDGPWRRLGQWLNLEAVLQQGSGLPQVTELRAGRLPVPAWLAGWLLRRVLAERQLEAPAQLALQAVNRVTFLPRVAVVAFAWPDANLRQALANSLLSTDDQQRVRVHAEHLARLRETLGPGRPRIPLAQLLPPLAQLAQQRLRHGGPAVGTASEELRAMLLALSIRALPQLPGKLLPAAQRWAPMGAFTMTLREREDFPLHFLVSAVIAAEGSGPMADAVGVYKEIADSRGGSGFSFNDIAADRAGTRLGLLTNASPEVLLQRLARPLTDGELMPPVDDLPEFLTAAQFRARYGDVGSPVYRAQTQDIEARLDALPLLAAPR